MIYILSLSVSNKQMECVSIDEEHETHFSDAKFRITEVAFVLFI